MDKKDMRKVIKEEINCNGKNTFSSVCFNPWLNMEIRVSGRVTACRICNDETGCENILDKSLKDIWLGEYFKNMRREFLKGNLSAYCSDCASGIIVDMRKLREQLDKRRIF